MVFPRMVLVEDGNAFLFQLMVFSSSFLLFRSRKPRLTSRARMCFCGVLEPMTFVSFFEDSPSFGIEIGVAPQTNGWGLFPIRRSVLSDFTTLVLRVPFWFKFAYFCPVHVSFLLGGTPWITNPGLYGKSRFSPLCA